MLNIPLLSISKTLIFLAMMWSVPITGAAATDREEKSIIGWVETVQILPDNISLVAKIDTGADNSSLNATDPIEFMKGDEPWIRFSMPLEAGEAVTVERPLERYTRIKRKRGASLKRAVVLLDLCVGTLLKKDVPVNLANRTGFKYPMLIGRSFLKGSALVDSAHTLTRKPACSGPSSE